MYMAKVADNAWVQSVSTLAYGVGLGDFTLIAMVRMKSPGVFLEYRYYDSRYGFQVGITSTGAIQFNGREGNLDNTHYIYSIDGIIAADERCRVISIVRKNGYISIQVDSNTVQLSNGDHFVKFPWDLNLPEAESLYIGQGRNDTAFTGSMMNVGVWSRALNSTELGAAGFAVLSDLGSELRGYWTLNHTLDDSSTSNNPATLMGKAAFTPCLRCIWAQGKYNFNFLQMQRHPVSADNLDNSDDNAARAIQETLYLDVEKGAKAISFASLYGENGPVGAGSNTVLHIYDPKGQLMNNTPNSDSFFIYPGNGVAHVVTALNPMPGKWRVAVRTSVGQSVFIQAQVVPSHDMAKTILGTLQPLLNPKGTFQTDHAVGLSWSTLWKSAAVTYGALAVVAIVAPEVALPAAAATTLLSVGVGANMTETHEYMRTQEPNFPNAQYSVAGSARFIFAQQKMLLIDPGITDNFPERTIYKQRKKWLFPTVKNSSFQDNYQQLIGEGATLESVNQALDHLGPGLVSASGHGEPDNLLGIITDGKHRRIITRASMVPSRVNGKIFHIFACSTASMLGKRIVENGGIAFFGYTIKFTIPKNSIDIEVIKMFCQPDIELDKALIEGKTCGQAYDIASAFYTRNIERLKETQPAIFTKTMQENFDGFVSPSTDAIYGNPDAYLSAGTR